MKGVLAVYSRMLCDVCLLCPDSFVILYLCIIVYFMQALTGIYWYIMPPKEKKCGSRVVDPDKLSNLPENIIDAIVMDLSLRDAVRTSILSKTWRYNWCRLSVLMLDQVLWNMTNNATSPTTRFYKHYLPPIDPSCWTNF